MATTATEAITIAGLEWEMVLTEVEWLQEEQGDLTDLIVAIQDQLPEDYADR